MKLNVFLKEDPNFHMKILEESLMRHRKFSFMVALLKNNDNLILFGKACEFERVQL